MRLETLHEGTRYQDMMRAYKYKDVAHYIYNGRIQCEYGREHGGGYTNDLSKVTCPDCPKRLSIDVKSLK